MSEFKVTGPGEYRTRGGRKAIVAGVNPEAESSFRAMGWVGESGLAWHENGRVFLPRENINDIVAIWTEPRKGEFWVNVYEGSQGNTWPTREDADRGAVDETPRLACIHVQWTEGEGL